MQIRPVPITSPSKASEIVAFLAPFLSKLSPVAALFISAILSALTSKISSLGNVNLLSTGAVESAPIKALELTDSRTKEDILAAVDALLKEVYATGNVVAYAQCLGALEGLIEALEERRNP